MRTSEAPDQTPGSSELVAALRVIAQAVAPGQAQGGTPYYDQHTSPLGEHAYKSAVRGGAFPAFRVGKRLLARREVVDAWIESEAHRVSGAPAELRDEIDEVLAGGGVARAR